MPDEEAAVSLDACRLPAKCPDDLIHYFTSLSEPRQEREVFTKGGQNRSATVGATWLHPDFALGTVNVGNLWNQCRPLVAYFKTDQGVAALRLRCLHDGYDYSSGAFFSVQDKGDVLGAVGFATDGGDTHPGLDRVQNATIKAKDFRLRFEIEGELGKIRLPEKPDLREPIRLRLGDVVCDIKIGRAAFGDFPIKAEITAHKSDDPEDRRKSLGLDLVFYSGERRDLSFRDPSEAVTVFALSMGPASGATNETFSGLTVERNRGKTSATWRRNGQPEMALTVPDRPATFGSLRSAASGTLGGVDVWK
jgi:hypothetical protein